MMTIAQWLYHRRNGMTVRQVKYQSKNYFEGVIDDLTCYQLREGPEPKRVKFFQVERKCAEICDALGIAYDLGYALWAWTRFDRDRWRTAQ